MFGDSQKNHFFLCTTLGVYALHHGVGWNRYGVSLSATEGRCPMNLVMPQWLRNWLVVAATVASGLAITAGAIPSTSPVFPIAGGVVGVTAVVLTILHALGVFGEPINVTSDRVEDVRAVAKGGYTRTEVLSAAMTEAAAELLKIAGEVRDALKVTSPPFPGKPGPTPPTPEPKSRVQTVVWFNEAPARISNQQCQDIVDGLEVQVPEFVAIWGKSMTDHHVFRTNPEQKLGAGEWPAYFLSNSDVAGALGYHDVDPQGRPYTRVFIDDVLKAGGTISSSPNSVSACASHEACEMAADPSCIRTAVAPNGDVWALETADPVESDGYLAPGTSVYVSNFVGPAFFGIGTGPLDKMGRVTAPFTIEAGGYAIINDQATFGAEYPAWRWVTKQHPAARTARRLERQSA